MNINEHLTKKQLSDYSQDKIPGEDERREIGRHLLSCESCLKRLPLPTKEQFFRAVFGEKYSDDLK